MVEIVGKLMNPTQRYHISCLYVCHYGYVNAWHRIGSLLVFFGVASGQLLRLMRLGISTK